MTTLYYPDHVNGQDVLEADITIDHETTGSIGQPTYGYASPVLAALMSPACEKIDRPELWECECEVRDLAFPYGHHVYWSELTTIKVTETPAIEHEDRVRFAIACALKVYDGEEFAKWVEGWSSGADRSGGTADNVADDIFTAACEAQAEADAAQIRADALWAAGAAASAASYLDSDRFQELVIREAANSAEHAAKSNAESYRIAKRDEHDGELIDFAQIAAETIGANSDCQPETER